MKKISLTLIVSLSIFSSLVFATNYKNYTTNSYASGNDDGYYFEFGTRSLTRNSTLNFIRHSSNCDSYTVVIRAFDILTRPSQKGEVVEKKYFGEARIDYGSIFPFTWALIFLENSTDVLMMVDETHDSRRLVDNLIKGRRIDITLFIDDKKDFDSFSLMGFTAASVSSYNECEQYNNNVTYHQNKYLNDAKQALNDAGLPVNEETIRTVIERMQEDAKLGIEPNARRAVISIQREIIELQKKYFEERQQDDQGKKYLNL